MACVTLWVVVRVCVSDGVALVLKVAAWLLVCDGDGVRLSDGDREGLETCDTVLDGVNPRVSVWVAVRERVAVIDLVRDGDRVTWVFRHQPVTLCRIQPFGEITNRWAASVALQVLIVVEDPKTTGVLTLKQ